MGIFLAIVVAVIFLAISILSMIAYGGTPHGGPTTTCAPITIFGQIYTAQADCRIISVAELGVAGLFLFLAIFVALAARPRGR